MGAIHILPEIIQNQIAAGEVVERPASIVKELLENSIDAGATHVRISIEDGGHRKIRIQDDGCGMDEQDLLLACVRYATSKLRTPEELFEIAQYGFRGEALASIASVSRVTIKSKQSEDAVGKEVFVEAGVIGEVVDTAIPKGTIISIEDIFFNIPARKKYLKAAATEFNHISTLVFQYALLHWDKEFLLVHNGKTTLHVQPANAWEQRLEHLLSPQHQGLEPVFLDSNEVQIRGFFSPPHLSGKKQQYLYVNGRPIKSALISKAIKEAYHRLLADGDSPFVLLSLEVAPSLVDVNVHPRKTEVRFRDEGAIFRTVLQVLRTALSESGVRSPDRFSVPFHSQEFAEKRLETTYQVPSTTYSHASSPYSLAKAARHAPTAQVRMHLEDAFHDAPHVTTGTQDFQILAQLHRSYILIALADGFAIIDQHAAHERILFERYRLKQEQDRVPSQPLTVPEVLHLNLSEQHAVQEMSTDLERIGFTLQDMGGGSIGLTHVPALLGDRSLTQAFMEILEDARAHVPLEASLIKTQDRLLAYSACKGATKFGDTLSIPEMEQLLVDYFATPLRSTCPHGRPSIREFSLHELAGFFRRPF